MKTLRNFGAALCCSLTVFACSSDKTTSETSDSSMTVDTNINDTTTNNITAESTVDDEGATFMKKAAVGGMMEVEAGKVAAMNASSQAVKDFAALMVKDHTAAGDELKALAASKKVMLPSALPQEEQMHLDNMKKMTGKAFDSHYMEMMVTDHAKTVALFKDGAKNRDQDVKNWAEKTLKTIEGHYEMSKNIKTGK